MPTNRKLLGAAAFSLALAGGGVAGALLGTPSLSGAQDGTDESTDTRRRTAGARGSAPTGARRSTAAAEAIGITEDELRAALEGGQSIAQVAEAEGVDVQTVIDALVADGTERLEAAIDELPERMADAGRAGGPARSRCPGGPRPRARSRRPASRRPPRPSASPTDELRPRWRDGSTIAEVAAANDVEVRRGGRRPGRGGDRPARRGGRRRSPHRGRGRRAGGRPRGAHHRPRQRRASCGRPRGAPRRTPTPRRARPFDDGGRPSGASSSRRWLPEELDQVGDDRARRGRRR